MPRWLGIDPGEKRIGVAVGGTGVRIASPVGVVPAQPRRAAIDRIRAYAGEYGATGLVVGWPLNMDGTEGPQARQARALAAELAGQTGLDVRLWDERLSSFAADQALAGLLTRDKRKARQDAVAAAAMLQEFLSSGGPETAPGPGDPRDE